MPQYQPPVPMPDWAEGADALVSQPTPSLQASGYTTNARPTAQSLNWVLRQLGRSIRWLGQGVNAVLVGAQQETDFRLIGGGAWKWDATAGTLSWSETAYIACPGYADTANFISAGSVNLSAGQIAYVAANVPFSTTGTTTSGSATVSNLAFESGITVGAAVTGPGIAAGSSVAAISQADSSITLSKPATASAANVSLVFGGGNAQLTVQAAANAGFVPAANTVVIARCYAQNGTSAAIQLGVNAGVTRVLDGESKALLGNGYVTTMRAVAGAAIAARQPVYISPGASDSRTAGSAYPLDVSATGTSARATLAGVAASAVASGGMCEIVLSGRLAGFGTLTPGATYYASPTTPATLQLAAPTASGQYVVPVGTAISADVLAVNRTSSLPVAALGSTSTFAGPVSAPGFISAAGFKTIWDAGTIYVSPSTANTTYPTTVLAASGVGTQASQFDSEVAGLPVPYSGSILSVSTYSRGTGSGNAVVTIRINNTTLASFTAPVGASAVGTFYATKGQYSFTAGDVLSASAVFANAGQQNLKIYLWLDVPAA